MTKKLKLTTIGSSVGVILPKDMLGLLRVGKGDILYAVETPNGFELSQYDAEVDEQLTIAEQVMREDRDVLRKLAQ
ncbi:MAG: hypothetical protein WKF34_01085 [Pyrinomonadaceae bacterium]